MWKSSESRKKSLVSLPLRSYDLSRLQRSQRQEELFLFQAYSIGILQSDWSFVERGQNAIQVRKSIKRMSRNVGQRKHDFTSTNWMDLQMKQRITPTLWILEYIKWFCHSRSKIQLYWWSSCLAWWKVLFAHWWWKLCWCSLASVQEEFCERWR